MMPTIEQIKPIISRRTRSIIITLAILLNLLIIAFFLFMQLDLDDTSFIHHLRKMRTVLKKKHKKEEWATLSPKTNQLGAPVVLMQTPQQQSKPAPSTQQKQPLAPHTQSKNTALDNAEVIQNKKEKSSSETATQEKIEKMEQVDPTKLVKNVTIDAQSATAQKNKSASLKHAIKAALAKKIKESAHIQQATKQEKIAIMKTQKTVPQKLSTKAVQEKQKLTFAQLVKGFDEHLKHEKKFTLAMAGKNSAKATEDQLRFGRFLQKITQCLQVAWKTNRSKYPLNHRVLADIKLRIVINKDGSLYNLAIIKTSGRQIIDTFVRNVIKDASKSFPPIPNYLGVEVCSLNCDWPRLPLPEGPPSYIVSQ